MNWYDKLKPILKGLKWGVIGAVILSGWIIAAWIKADLRPSNSWQGSKAAPVILEPLKPSSGQQWLFNECVPLYYLGNDSQGQNASRKAISLEEPTSTPPFPVASQSAEPERLPEALGVVYPLGKFLVPAAGRDPLWATPLLDSQTGKTTLKVEPAGGFARFGGERYAFIEASYQKSLQSDFSLSDVPALSIGLHQDLGRIGKLELMAEGWLQGSLIETPLNKSVELGAGMKLRAALPF